MAKVLNFGSLNIDYVYSVGHFVRAGETISSTNKEVFCGGKGLNQSIALARSGANVHHAGAVGDDGGILVKVLDENHVDTSFVRTVSGSSGHAIIQREPGGQNCIIIFGGSNRKISNEHIQYTLESFGEGDYLVLQNEINNLPELMQSAKKRGLQIVLNPSPLDEAIEKLPLELVDIFILNEIEGQMLCGESEPAEIMAALRRRFFQSAIVLTMGRMGVWYQDSKMDTPLQHGVYSMPVVDTTAAGDTFTGFFVSCISRGDSVAYALEIASKAAALTVSRQGAAPSIPTMVEIQNANLQLEQGT